MAGSRVFVQEGIYDEFVKKLSEKVKTWVVGDPFDPKVRQGPQASALNINILDESMRAQLEFWLASVDSERIMKNKTFL